MNNFDVGFIGYGNMAKAISKAILKNNPNMRICFSDIIENSYDGITQLADNATVAKSAKIVFLSIKPQTASVALDNVDFAKCIVVSIMAGVSVQTLFSLCKSAKKVVRVMPNLCARVGEAVSAFCTQGLSEDEKEEVKGLLSSFGLSCELDEEYFDLITGLTGSSPAYTFRYAKNLVACGVKHGLSFENARDLVLYCIKGCCDCLVSCNSIEDIQTSIDNVCSKGGTTIEGIYKLDEGNFDNTVVAAIDAAIRKSKELGKK